MLSVRPVATSLRTVDQDSTGRHGNADNGGVVQFLGYTLMVRTLSDSALDLRHGVIEGRKESSFFRRNGLWHFSAGTQIGVVTSSSDDTITAK